MKTNYKNGIAQLSVSGATGTDASHHLCLIARERETPSLPQATGPLVEKGFSTSKEV
jgi:hypothetical protein